MLFGHHLFVVILIAAGQGGERMTKKILILFCLAFLPLFLENLALADCLDFSKTKSWYVEGRHTIVFYSGMMPIARMEVPYCRILVDSQLRMTKKYMCDTDRIIVDGDTCAISSITSASGSSF